MQCKDLRISYLKFAIVFTTLVVLSTELLSIFYLFTSTYLMIFWSIVIWSYVLVCRFKKKYIFPDIKFSIKDYSATEKTLVYCTSVIFLILGGIALLAPANNYDSMTYHMSRTSHWIQNQSVGNYATHIARQLWAGPLAEYFIVQSRLIWQTDIAVNCVQFSAMLGSCFGVSWIAGYFGAQRRTQLLSAFLCSTIPMGILQATSTQNDYVVAFWLVCFVSFLLRYQKSNQFENIIFAGLSLGFGFLTKGTMYIYAGMMVIFFLVILKQRAIKPLLLICVLALSVNGFQYARNYDLGGHILSPMQDSQNLVNKDKSFKSGMSLVVRNVGLHLATPIESLNEWMDNSIAYLHQKLKVDINDSDTTLSHSFSIDHVVDEDASGNFRHLLFFLFALCVFFVKQIFKDNKPLTLYLLYLIISFVTLSVYLKWQVWGSRLHLPWFVLITPFMAIALDRITLKGFVIGLTIIFLACSMPYLTKNPKKRLFSSKKTTLFNAEREQLYFITEGDLYPIYDSIAGLIKHADCRTIGLDIGADDWEYPWWVLLDKRISDYVLRHIKVENVSRKYQVGEFTPCAVISRGDKALETKEFHFRAKAYDRVYLQNYHALYLKRRVTSDL